MAVLGHDLRGPLSAMLMSAMVLERRAETEAVARGRRPHRCRAASA